MSSNSLSPGSQSSLREANAARVIEAVSHYGQITQVELAAATGLSQATISNIVKQLIEGGAVKTENTIRSGRRAQLVRLARRSGIVAGIQIGHRKLRIELSDLNLEHSSSQTLPLPVDHRVDTTLDRTTLILVDMLERIGSEVPDLSAVGVTLPAPIDPVTGRIALPGSMNGWEGIDIAEVLAHRLGSTVLVENDANAAAWGEHRFGALRGHPSGLFVRASYTMGAGIIFDGGLLRGTRGTAGEIGHVQVDPSGLICPCGARGCLNTVVGADVIVDYLRLSRGPQSFPDVVRAAATGDPGCRQVISDAGATVGTVLANQAVFFAPEVVVVGGEMATTGDVFLAPLRDALAARPLLGDSVRVIAGELGERAEALGALAFALDSVDLPMVPSGSEGADR